MGKSTDPGVQCLEVAEQNGIPHDEAMFCCGYLKCEGCPHGRKVLNAESIKCDPAHGVGDRKGV